MGKMHLTPSLREQQICWTCRFCLFEPVTTSLRYTCELTDDPISDPKREKCNEWEDE